MANSTPRAPRLLPGLSVARKVLIEAQARVGGMDTAILALDITIEQAAAIEAREVAQR